MNNEPNENNAHEISIVETAAGSAPPPVLRLTHFKSGVVIEAGGGNKPRSSVAISLTFDDGKASTGNIVVSPSFALKLAQSLLEANSRSRCWRPTPKLRTRVMKQGASSKAH